jgi:hypothetical protein
MFEEHTGNTGAAHNLSIFSLEENKLQIYAVFSLHESRLPYSSSRLVKRVA